MAGQIAKAGFDLTVHDLRRDAAVPLLDAGAAWADSPKDVAERSDIVCTCVPGPAEMEPVALGEDGLASGLRPGTVYVDHTTNSPALVRRVKTTRCRPRGIDMLDAPVSGGMEGAQTTRLDGARGRRGRRPGAVQACARRDGQDRDPRRPHRRGLHLQDRPQLRVLRP